MGLFFCICLAAGPIQAQVTASVSGRVEDSTEAAVQGASITVTSLETRAARTLRSDEAGTYRVLSLPVGRYEVKAEAAGFRTPSRPGSVWIVGEAAGVRVPGETWAGSAGWSGPGGDRFLGLQDHPNHGKDASALPGGSL